jgi:hypothetical protein
MRAQSLQSNNLLTGNSFMKSKNNQVSINSHLHSAANFLRILLRACTQLVTRCSNKLKGLRGFSLLETIRILATET